MGTSSTSTTSRTRPPTGSSPPSRRGTPPPDALAALGRICQSKQLDEDAEAFLRAALEQDDQNMSRHIDLAGLLAGAGRYADADAVLREGLMVYPHSSVLRELRQSMSLLAGAGV